MNLNRIISLETNQTVTVQTILMQSRIRKYRKSYSNYQEAVQKHLQDDFLVSEYLNSNKLSGNIEEYMKLLNSIQVIKNDKLKKFNSLKLKFCQMNSEKCAKQFQSSRIELLEIEKNKFMSKFEEVTIQLSNETEVKNNLFQQIIQTKKTLNLLKGDIGHLVSRNESAKLLESKMSKVKIVADDQLKRVSLAFVKDQSQLKVRAQMQKKFSKKLKNVSIFQDTTLNRLKKTYLEAMVKKKEINSRLNIIEKVSASINKSGQKQKMKNQINRRTLSLYNSFMKLTDLISKVLQKQAKLLENPGRTQKFIEWVEQYSQKSSIKTPTFSRKQLFSRDKLGLKSQVIHPQAEAVNSEDLFLVTRDNLMRFFLLVKQQYHRINEEIQTKISEYNYQMKRSEEIVSKLDFEQKQIDNLQMNFLKQMGLKYQDTAQSRQQYTFKLKNLAQNLKVLFSFLQFVQKYINYSSKTQVISSSSQLPSFKCIHHQSLTIDSKKPSFQHFNSKPASQLLQNYNICYTLIKPNTNYISDLYKTYYFLAKDAQSDFSQVSRNIDVFDNLNLNIGKWLLKIKQSLFRPKQTMSKKLKTMKKLQIFAPLSNQTQKIRESMLSLIVQRKRDLITQEDQAQEQKQFSSLVRSNYLRRPGIFQNSKSYRSHSRSPSNLSVRSKCIKTTENSFYNGNQIRRSQTQNPSSKLINVQKLNQHCTQHFQQAKRIKLLQDIDKDYYKMLKSTLIMQKQNTRKNYQFLKTFKRTKYSSRDQILEQKRFQCSFSILFAGKKNKLLKKKPSQQKSQFLKTQNIQRRLSKFNQLGLLFRQKTLNISAEEQKSVKTKLKSNSLIVKGGSQSNLSVEKTKIANFT